MKKLLLFGSFFLLSFLPGLTVDRGHVRVDGYEGSNVCNGLAECDEGYVTGIYSNGAKRCSYIYSGINTGKKSKPNN